MDGSKCPLILKCAQLKHAETSKEEMKDGSKATSWGLLKVEVLVIWSGSQFFKLTAF